MLKIVIWHLLFGDLSQSEKNSEIEPPLLIYKAKLFCFGSAKYIGTLKKILKDNLMTIKHGSYLAVSSLIRLIHFLALFVSLLLQILFCNWCPR